MPQDITPPDKIYYKVWEITMVLTHSCFYLQHHLETWDISHKMLIELFFDYQTSLQLKIEGPQNMVKN